MKEHHWLIKALSLATLCAAAVEIYWMVVFCIEATGGVQIDFDSGSKDHLWQLAFSARIVVLLGLIVASTVIVIWSMIWLPLQMEARGTGPWRRGSMIAWGVLANIVVCFGGTTVMNSNRQEQVRSGVVREEAAAQGVEAIRARLSVAQGDLDKLTAPNIATYQAQAARDGAAAWARRVQIAAGMTPPDPQLAMLQKAQASAEKADALHKHIEDLQVEIATAAPAAATAAHVTDTDGATLDGIIRQGMVWRPPVIALCCTLIGIFGAFWRAAFIQREIVDTAVHAAPLMIANHMQEKPVYTPADAARDVADAMMAGGADPRFAADMARSAADAKTVNTSYIDENGMLVVTIPEHVQRRKPKNKDGLASAEVIVPPVFRDEEKGSTSPSDQRIGRPAEAWASNLMEEVDDPDRGVDAVDSGSAGLSGGLDSGDAPGSVAAVDDREPEQAVDVPRDVFDALVAAGKYTKDGILIVKREPADYGEMYGPWLPGPLPESHQLPAPAREEEDA